MIGKTEEDQFFLFTIECCSVSQLCPTLCNPMDCSTPGLPVPHYLLEFVQVHVHCMGDAISSHFQTFFSFCPLSFPASGTFPMSHLCASYCANTGFSFSISPSSEYSELISLKIDWFDLLVVQGTFGCLLQHHSSKA